MKKLNTARGAGRLQTFVYAVATTFVMSTACVEVEPAEPSDRYATAMEPIVGGATETGFPEVGALVIDFGGYWGFFCSATLIDPNWVLTAAHCLEEDEWGELEPYMVSWYQGNDARNASSNVYNADGFYTHSGYNPNADYDWNDIALVHLSDTVGGVTPAPLHDDILPNGTPITWVGFGADNGVSETGGGIKRRGEGEVADKSFREYYYLEEEIDAMPCVGDSGGPGFTYIDGVYHVAGIVSRGGANCSGAGADTRVDYYANWIESTMAGGGDPTNCAITGGDCSGRVCWPVDDNENACLPSDGVSVGQSCNADMDTWDDSLPCEDGAVCIAISESNPSAGECFAFCLSNGDCSGADECYIPIFQDDDDIGVCVEAQQPCTVTGHECPEGQGCYPVSETEAACFQADNAGVGEACNPDMDTWTSLPCADGLICLQVSETDPSAGECYAFCMGAVDCGVDEECFAPIFVDVDDVGVCLCIDNDDDFWCQADDCDDNNGNVNPGAAEACDDGLDNNCNGFTDEGCNCDDFDGDGFCPPDDCDDNNAGMVPTSSEVCDDGIDNNCDGAIDGDDASCEGNPDLPDVNNDDDDGGGRSGGGSVGCSTVGTLPGGLGGGLLGVFGFGLALAIVRRRTQR